jgi:membrane protease YdiL (CAAX protease family)
MKPLPAPIWFVAAFIPMVASQVLRLHQHDPAGWLFWDYAGRLGGLAVLAALAWPVTFRREKLRMPWNKSPYGSSVSSSRITTSTGSGRPAGISFRQQFLETIRCPRLHWFDTLFGIGLDTYTEEVVFRRCARHVFKPYVGDGMPMVLLTSLLFGAYHWWSGVGNILAAVVMGVLFMLFYRRSGSLWPVVLSHYLTDIADFA